MIVLLTTMELFMQSNSFEMVSTTHNTVDLSNIRVDQDENNNSWMTCPFNASGILESCINLIPETAAQQKAIGSIIGLVVVGVILVVSLNNSNCSEVYVTNKTDDFLYPLSAGPFGTKVKPSIVVFPGANINIKFNGVNSYANLEFSNDMTFHFAHFGKTFKLENGPANYILKKYPKGFFTQCKFKYEKSNSASALTATEETHYLRGSQNHYTMFSDVDSKPKAEYYTAPSDDEQYLTSAAESLMSLTA